MAKSDFLRVPRTEAVYSHKYERFRARRILRTTAVVSICGAFVLSGCGSEETVDPANPYAEEIRHSQEEASSEFEREVLKDGEVSREEYVEALDRYVSCIQEQGSSVALVESAGIFVYSITGSIDLYDSVADGCSKGNKHLIEPLYVEILADPQKKGYDQVTAECMVALGIVDDSFTGTDFAELWGREEREEANDPASREILDDPDTLNCYQNPGYARLQEPKQGK